jgi:hypothetical protein
MSTTDKPILSLLADPRPPQRSGTWWEQFAQPCAGAECGYRGKLWPSWLRKFSGTEFEGRWYCDFNCMKPVLMARVRAILGGFIQEKPRTYRLPIGLLLVHRGVITSSHLREALNHQRESGQRRLGEVLREMKLLTDQQLAAALASQWGCPVYPLERQPTHLSYGELLPLPLLESSRSVPAYFSADGQTLHLAFGERLDHTTLYAVGEMLACRTFPCVASESSVEQALDHFRRTIPRQETCFDTIREPREMAWTICSYAEHLKSSRTSIVRAGAYVWVRFFRDKSTRDLLFRILPESRPAHLHALPGNTKAFASSADMRKDGVSPAAKPV